MTYITLCLIGRRTKFSARFRRCSCASAGKFMRRALTHIQRKHYSIYAANSQFSRKFIHSCSCIIHPTLPGELSRVASRSPFKMSTLSNGAPANPSLALPGGAPLRVKNSLSKEKVLECVHVANSPGSFQTKEGE